MENPTLFKLSQERGGNFKIKFLKIFKYNDFNFHPPQTAEHKSYLRMQLTADILVRVS